MEDNCQHERAEARKAIAVENSCVEVRGKCRDCGKEVLMEYGFEGVVGEW